MAEGELLVGPGLLYIALCNISTAQRISLDSRLAKSILALTNLLILSREYPGILMHLQPKDCAEESQLGAGILSSQCISTAHRVSLDSLRAFSVLARANPLILSSKHPGIL